jgi:hypothetical protein
MVEFEVLEPQTGANGHVDAQVHTPLNRLQHCQKQTVFKII